MANLSPISSEFETKEQATSYDRWFRRKVQESLEDPGPGTPHDQMMAEMEAVISQAEKQRQNKG
ncbi:stability determinant [Pseudomonas sp. Pseusp97]|uniref:type II toxin-antitoxin system RelB family antitoxin n=1 Tax=Pseudomonas sp. Pseusp97 TaxID=3243065 RepID=UPI0039A6690C